MTKKKKKNKILSAAAVILTALLFIVVLYSVICNVRGKIAFFGGRAVIRIVSESMEPVIPTGEYITVKKLSEKEISELEVGDVIVFRSRDPQIYGKLNTHRIAGIINGETGTVFETKGDNNPVKDSTTVQPGDIEAIYTGNSDAVTKIAGFFSGKTTFLLVVLIPAAVMLVLCIIDVAKKSNEVKMERLVKAEVEKLKKADEKDDEK